MTETKFDTEKFDGKNDFALWQVRMKALLEQQGLASSLKELHAATIATYNNFLQKKAYSALILCFGDRVLQEITKETTKARILKKFETLYMTKSLANPVETLLYGWDTLKLEDMLVTLNSRGLQKLTEAKGNGGKGLYNHKKSQGFQKMTEAKGDGGRKQQTQVSDSGADGECRVRGTCKVQVQMRDGSSSVLDNVREHGRMILELVEHVPLIWPTIEENGVTRTKKYEELSATEKIQADCDLKATNIILQGLPSDVYSLVNHHRVAKDLWERVQLLMQGTSLTKQERECKLYNAFDKFAHIKEESLHQYYLRFIQLINDMNIYKMKLEQFQVNTKFLNSLPPEWIVGIKRLLDNLEVTAAKVYVTAAKQKLVLFINSKEKYAK
ncbi:hypothetical protein Tco_0554095 [Tanacetum coccineum]